MKQNALLKTVGIAFFVQLIFFGISTWVSFRSTAQMMEGFKNFENSPTAPTAPNLAAMALPQLICFIGLFFPIGYGILYAYFHSGEAKVEMSSGALGGAVSAIAINLLFAVISALFVTPRLQAMMSEAMPQAAFNGMGAIMAASVVFSLILSIVGNGFLGGIGGAIGAALFGKREPQEARMI